MLVDREIVGSKSAARVDCWHVRHDIQTEISPKKKKVYHRV